MTTLQYINYPLFKGRMVCANWWERTPTTLRPSSQGPQINLHQQSSTSLVEVIPTVSISLSKEKATNKVCARLHVALHSSLVPFHFMIWFVLRVKPVASCLNIEYTVPSLLHFGVFFFFTLELGMPSSIKMSWFKHVSWKSTNMSGRSPLSSWQQSNHQKTSMKITPKPPTRLMPYCKL